MATDAVYGEVLIGKEVKNRNGLIGSELRYAVVVAKSVDVHPPSRGIANDQRPLSVGILSFRHDRAPGVSPDGHALACRLSPSLLRKLPVSPASVANRATSTAAARRGQRHGRQRRAWRKLGSHGGECRQRAVAVDRLPGDLHFTLADNDQAERTITSRFREQSIEPELPSDLGQDFPVGADQSAALVVDHLGDPVCAAANQVHTPAKAEFAILQSDFAAEERRAVTGNESRRPPIRAQDPARDPLPKPTNAFVPGRVADRVPQWHTHAPSREGKRRLSRRDTSRELFLDIRCTVAVPDVHAGMDKITEDLSWGFWKHITVAQPVHGRQPAVQEAAEG